MCRRRHRVLRDQRVAVGRVELRRAASAEAQVGGTPARLEVGARRRSVHDEHGLGMAREDRLDRVLGHELPRRAADAGALTPVRAQPEVLADLDRREQTHPRRRETVDVVLGEPRVGERAPRPADATRTVSWCRRARSPTAPRRRWRRVLLRADQPPICRPPGRQWKICALTTSPISAGSHLRGPFGVVTSAPSFHGM